VSGSHRKYGLIPNIAFLNVKMQSRIHAAPVRSCPKPTTRYGLTATQLTAVLGRIAQEGWAERKPGYGWQFSAMLTTPDSLMKSYRLRRALEPAALLEPNCRLDPKVIERCRAAERHLLDGGIETDTADQLHDRGVRFHEPLVEASGNAFFIDTIKRVNRVRRLLSYRSMQHRERYKKHCKQHLHILALLEKEHNEDASEALREHLQHTLDALARIGDILKPQVRFPPTFHCSRLHDNRLIRALRFLAHRHAARFHQPGQSDSR
jgi:DNA-binding GntR family transcriptional regulator